MDNSKIICIFVVPNNIKTESAAKPTESTMIKRQNIKLESVEFVGDHYTQEYCANFTNYNSFYFGKDCVSDIRKLKDEIRRFAAYCEKNITNDELDNVIAAFVDCYDSNKRISTEAGYIEHIAEVVDHNNITADASLAFNDSEIGVYEVIVNGKDGEHILSMYAIKAHFDEFVMLPADWQHTLTPDDFKCEDGGLIVPSEVEWKSYYMKEGRVEEY